MLRYSFLHYLLGKKKNTSCRNQTSSKCKSLRLEALEDRHMLSVTFEMPPMENTYTADTSGTVVNPDLIAHDKVFSADFNNDKTDDILIIKKNSSAVHIYRNNGSTTNAFSDDPVIFVPSAGIHLLTSAAVGELTGDGNIDLITGYPEDDVLNFSTYRGDGKCDFFPSPINTTFTGLKDILANRGITVPAGGELHVLSMDITLVNNNGKIDMICAVGFITLKGDSLPDSTGTINLLFTNDGTGKFNAAPTVLATSSGIFAAGDLVGSDTKPEYVVKNDAPNEKKLTIYLNAGTQSTITTPNYSYPVDQVFVAQCYREGTGSNANKGDVGKMEIITTHTNETDNSYYLCVTTISGSSANIGSYCPLGIVPVNVVTGDFNNDGYLDIFVSDGNVYQTLLGQADKTFVRENAVIANGDFETSYVADFDGDGIADVLAVGQRFAWLVPGNTSKDPVVVYDFTKEGITPKDVAFGDFNGDGKMDFAVLSFNGDEVFVFSNTSTSSKASFAKTSILTVFGGKQLLVANFDNANGDDIVVYGLDLASAAKPTLQTYLSTASGFGGVKTSELTDKDSKAAVFFDLLTIGEVTNDGYTDIVGIINGNANKVQSAYRVLSNTSSDAGRFTVGDRTTFENPTTNPTAVAIGDLTGDGRNDLVILDAYGKQILMLPQSSTLSGSFRPGDGYIVKTPITTATVDLAAFSQLTIADFNADGALDVLVGMVTNSGNTQFRVLENDPAKLGTMKPDTNFITVGNFAGTTSSGLSIRIGLLDNNGTPDVVIVGGNTVKRFINTNKTGADIGTVTLVFRNYSGAIVNTEVADLSTLANRLTYIDEWSNFWVEIWANSGSTAGISQFTTTLTFDANVFEVRSGSVVAGGAFNNNFTFNISEGKIVVSGSVLASAGTQGDNTNTMLARISFMPVSSTKVGGVETAGILLNYMNNDGYMTPVENGFSVDTLNSSLLTTTAQSGRPKIEISNNIPLIPVLFDINDSGAFDVLDFVPFAQAYLARNVDLLSFSELFDYDKNGIINVSDFILFSQNFTARLSREACRTNPNLSTYYSPAFLNAYINGWQPASFMLTSSLSDAIEEMSEVQTAVSTNSTTVQNQALMAYMASQDAKKDDFDINNLNPISETERLLAEGKL